MRIEALLPSFYDELEKIAASGNVKMKVDEHFKDPHWPSFEKNLKSKRFQAEASGDKRADAKLQRYIKNYGGYVTSTDVVGVVPSRSGSKMYKIKRLKDGRLGCGCKDWQYVHSHKGTDCDHIEELKQGMEKDSAYSPTLRAAMQLNKGAVAVRRYQKGKKQLHHGREVEKTLRTLNEASPY
jgi:hypothetical protein